MKKMNLATKGLIGIQFMKLHFLINVDQQKGVGAVWEKWFQIVFSIYF